MTQGKNFSYIPEKIFSTCLKKTNGQNENNLLNYQKKFFFLTKNLLYLFEKLLYLCEKVKALHFQCDLEYVSGIFYVSKT